MNPFFIFGTFGAFIVINFIEISEIYADSVDSVQTLYFAASELGLQCLPKSFFGTLDIIGLTHRTHSVLYQY